MCRRRPIYVDPPGTPFHQQTHFHRRLTLYTLGVWGLVWIGLLLAARDSKAPIWIYVGALCILAIIGACRPDESVSTPGRSVVTVTVLPASR